jgi:hypothetical protein
MEAAAAALCEIRSLMWRHNQMVLVWDWMILRGRDGDAIKLWVNQTATGDAAVASSSPPSQQDTVFLFDVQNWKSGSYLTTIIGSSFQ